MRKNDKFSEDIQLKGFCLKKVNFFQQLFYQIFHEISNKKFIAFSVYRNK